MFIVIQGDRDQRNGDTMVLDSVGGHWKTFEALTAFLASSDSSVELEGRGPCHLRPDAPTLRVFRMVKTDGRVWTEETTGDVLQVSGRADLLARYIDGFKFNDDQDGDHRHPENSLASTGDLALILRAGIAGGHGPPFPADVVNAIPEPPARRRLHGWPAPAT